MAGTAAPSGDAPAWFVARSVHSRFVLQPEVASLEEASTALSTSFPLSPGDAVSPASKKKSQGTRSDSKQAKLIEMLKRSDGATIDEIVKKFEWQPHTVRGAIAGALKKKLGLDVQSEKIEGRGRVYRIAG